MSTIYLPVEVGRRELMSRAFLATRLANEGHETFVFVSDFFDRWGWPGPGVYIGKNVLRSFPPHDLQFYHRMKAAGVALWYLDEESAIFIGDGPEEWAPQLGRRNDATVLARDDKMLVWGEFQKKYFEDLGAPPAIELVGSINFELYRPEYRDVFAEYDAGETGGLKDYVLFNTRFAAPNPFWFQGGHVINSSLYTAFVTDQERYAILAHEGMVMYDFIGLIADLALRFPDQQICLRPHPQENPQFYRDVFEPVANVRIADGGDAGSWIRRARCLVQNGCTTGLQANIAQKPVITFVPPGAINPSATCPLPNEVGTIVETREQAIAAIMDPPAEQPSGRWPVAISALDTIDRIAALVAAEAGPSATDEAHLRKIGRRNSLDSRLRQAAYRVIPGKIAEAATRERLLDRAFFARFPELVGIANRKWTAPVRVEQFSRDCWRVTPGRATR
jgi:surface carbohydrate biosynthesis protein